MKNLIKNNLSLFINDKKKALVLLVFAFVCGTSVGTAIETGMSAWEFVLFLMTNHYYIIYFLFMTYIFFSLENMNKESELVYVRMGTIKRQYICRVIAVFLQAFIYVMAHVAIATMVGVTAFGWTNEFNGIGLEDSYNELMIFLLAFRNYFSSPAVALVAVSLYLTFGLGCISMIIYFVQRIFSRRSTVVLVGVLILNVMLGFKLMPGGLAEMFFLNKFFILHHVLFLDGAWYVALNICVACGWIVAGYCLLRWRKGNRGSRRKWGTTQFNRKYVWYGVGFSVIYIVLNFVSSLIPEEVATASDVLFSVVLGYSAESFALTEFVRYVLFFVIPLFFVGAIWESERKARNQIVEIRYGSRKRWRRELTKGINVIVMKHTLLFAGILLALTGGAFVIFGNGISGYQKEFAEMFGMSERVLLWTMVFAFCLKCIELVYYKNIFCVIESFCRNTVVAYLLTFAGFLPGFIFSGSYFLSYGCSSLFLISAKVADDGMLVAILGTAVVLIIKIGILKLIEKHRKGRLYE